MNRRSMASHLAGWLLVGSLAGTAFAQAPAAPAPAPPAPGTAAPGHPKSIFDYQKDIGLSDQQVSQIKTAMTTFRNHVTQGQGKMQQLNQELTTLLKSQGDINAIRKDLQAEANLQVDLKIEDIETARTVHKIMTPAQWEKWVDIQKKMYEEQRGRMPMPPPNH